MPLQKEASMVWYGICCRSPWSCMYPATRHVFFSYYLGHKRFGVPWLAWSPLPLPWSARRHFFPSRPCSHSKNTSQKVYGCVIHYFYFTTFSMDDMSDVLKPGNRIGLDALSPFGMYLPVGAKKAVYIVRTSRGNNIMEPTSNDDVDVSTTDSSSSSEACSTRAKVYKPTPRRHSDPGIASSENNDGQKTVTIRRKSQPCHRNTSLNLSLPGIMKPPRYSSGDVPRRRASDPPCTNLDSSFHSLASNFSYQSSQRWVPSGVDFNVNMEVYYY